MYYICPSLPIAIKYSRSLWEFGLNCVVCRYPNLNKHLFSQMQVSHLYKSENPDRNSIKNIPKNITNLFKPRHRKYIDFFPCPAKLFRIIYVNFFPERLFSSYSFAASLQLKLGELFMRYSEILLLIVS